MHLQPPTLCGAASAWAAAPRSHLRLSGVNIEIEASAEPNTNEDSVPTPNGEPDCASQRGAAKLAQPSEEETIKTQEASAPCDARQMEAKDNTMPPHHEDKAKISEGHAKKKDVANKRKRADTKGDAKEKGSSSEEVSFALLYVSIATHRFVARWHRKAALRECTTSWVGDGSRRSLFSPKRGTLEHTIPRFRRRSRKSI